MVGVGVGGAEFAVDCDGCRELASSAGRRGSGAPRTCLDGKARTVLG